MNVLDFLDPDIRDPHSGAVIERDEERAEAREALVALIKAARKVVECGRDGGSSEELRNALAYVCGDSRQLNTKPRHTVRNVYPDAPSLNQRWFVWDERLQIELFHWWGVDAQERCTAVADALNARQWRA